jgi:O-antigen/teichoic acid export membrane protein
VALYVLPLQLAEYGRIMVYGIVSVMLPHLTALQVTGRGARFRSSYQRMLKITALVAVFLNVNLISLGTDFIRLWVGPAFSEHAFPLLVALGIASAAQGVSVQSQTPFCQALGRVRFAALVLIAEGVTNLVLSIALAPRFGITGVAAATAIPAVLMSGIMLPVYVARQVGVPLRPLLGHVVMPVGIFMAVITAAQVLVRLVISVGSFLGLAERFLVCALIAAVTGWMVASDSERRFVRIFMERRRRGLLNMAG